MQCKVCSAKCAVQRAKCTVCFAACNVCSAKCAMQRAMCGARDCLQCSLCSIFWGQQKLTFSSTSVWQCMITTMMVIVSEDYENIVEATGMFKVSGVLSQVSSHLIIVADSHQYCIWFI